jgi:hypothetical protein
MTPADRDLFAEEGPGSPAPLGWTLAMGLCNVLIALILLAFFGIVGFELRALF